MRQFIRAAVSCERCGKDEWYVYQGWNRCRCGQRLWVERVTDDDGAAKFPYRQGLVLPDTFRGWMRETA
ncbi:MAG: hypothetical protein CV089_23895 [Nitrospira sp. WS110]|nr:hypothetical protein [Nitrospira sp. WS110]